MVRQRKRNKQKTLVALSFSLKFPDHFLDATALLFCLRINVSLSASPLLTEHIYCTAGVAFLDRANRVLYNLATSCP